MFSSDVSKVDEGRRLIEEAAALDLTLRLLGGVALWLRASDEARFLIESYSLAKAHPRK